MGGSPGLVFTLNSSWYQNPELTDWEKNVLQQDQVSFILLFFNLLFAIYFLFYFIKWVNSGFFFVYFCSLQQFFRKIVDFSRNQTRIVRVEGEHADYLTTTTAQFFSLSILPISLLSVSICTQSSQSFEQHFSLHLCQSKLYVCVSSTFRSLPSQVCPCSGTISTSSSDHKTNSVVVVVDDLMLSDKRYSGKSQVFISSNY